MDKEILPYMTELNNLIYPQIDITTERLNLRILKVEDVTPKYVAALNDKEVVGLTESRYRSWNFEEVQDYIRNKGDRPGESMLVGIFIKPKQRHIGNIRVHSFSLPNSRAEVGIMIWDKNEWGKGYASEALGELVSFLFEEIKLHKICAEYYSVNKASEKMFEKLGYIVEGVFKDHFRIDEKFIDAVRVAKFNPQNDED